LPIIPLVYSASTLLLTGICLSWFYLPHFRHLVRNDRLRAGFVLVLLLAPNIEGVMFLAYIQWYLSLWAVLTLLMILPKNQWGKWGIAIVYILVINTAPVLVILLPLWLLRLFSTRTSVQQMWIGLLVIAHLVTLFLVFSEPNSSPTLASDLRTLWIDVARGFVYKVIILSLLGHDLAEIILTRLGWWALYTICLGFFSLSLLSLYILRSKNKTMIICVLLYIMLTSSALYATRSAQYGFMFANSIESVFRLNARYFLLGSMAIYLFGFMQVEELLYRFTGRFARIIIVISGIVLLSLYSLSFRFPALPGAQWSKYARMLTYLESSATTEASHTIKFLAAVDNSDIAHTKISKQNIYHIFLPLIQSDKGYSSNAIPIRVPITPPGWSMILRIPKNSPYIYNFPEGLTFLGTDLQPMSNSLEIDLFWQGNTVADLDNNTHYTAYVHLVDDRNSRLAGYDVLLESNLLEAFVSHHKIVLPGDILPGKYGLAIGLYHFQNDHLVPGSSIIVEKIITIQ
jgi:hypothetical protein